jgi:hypothetical protein
LAQPLEEDGTRTKLGIVVSALAVKGTDAGGVKGKKKLKVKLVG